MSGEKKTGLKRKKIPKANRGSRRGERVKKEGDRCEVISLTQEWPFSASIQGGSRSCRQKSEANRSKTRRKLWMKDTERKNNWETESSLAEWNLKMDGSIYEGLRSKKSKQIIKKTRFYLLNCFGITGSSRWDLLSPSRKSETAGASWRITDLWLDQIPAWFSRVWEVWKVGNLMSWGQLLDVF